MLKLTADFIETALIVPLILLGGLFKLLDRITGAVPGTAT
jgi:hypothetical protein